MIRALSKVDVATFVCFECLDIVVVIVLGGTSYRNVVF